LFIKLVVALTIILAAVSIGIIVAYYDEEAHPILTPSSK
jgi:hypothetical protein